MHFAGLHSMFPFFLCILRALIEILRLWLAIPAIGVFTHVMITCLQMRHFAWNCKLGEVNDPARN